MPTTVHRRGCRRQRSGPSALSRGYRASVGHIVRRALIVAGSAWLAWRLFGPDPVPRTSAGQRRLLRAPGTSVFVGRHEFFVRQVGPSDAPPILLIHGWSFDGEMVFHRAIPLLARNHRVVVPDLRNHGKSDRIRGRFEIGDLADEVAGIVRELGLPTPLPVFGYSMGGMVAQELAIRHPGVPSALVLGATAARPFDRARPLAWVALRLSRALARISRAEAVWGSFVALRRARVIPPEGEAWMWDALLSRDANLYHEAAFAIWRFDSRQRLRMIDVPVLVVITERDAVVPVRTQVELASHLHGARVVRLPDAGHESIITQPERYVAAVDDFLNGLASVDRGDETVGETARRSG